MSERKWKSGAKGCWWCIVPPWGDVFPWLMGSTRKSAWRAWREHHEGSGASASKWKCIRVFITETK